MNNSYHKYRVKQLDITDCGAACMASVLWYFGTQKSISVIRSDSGTDRNGTSLLGLIRSAEKYGLKALPVKVKDFQVRDEDLPAIAHLNIKNSWYHFVVIYKAEKNYLTIMDPASGEIEKVDKEKFRKHWTGVLLLLQPGKGFSPSEDKVSLKNRLFSIIASSRKQIILTVLAATVYSGLGIITALFIEQLTDSIIPNQKTKLLNTLTLAVLLIIVLRTTSGYLKNMIVIKTSRKIDSNLINNYNNHILQLPLSFHQSMQTGEIMTRINDAVKIRAFINLLSQEMAVNILIVTVSLSLMFRYSHAMTLILLSSIPLFAITYSSLNKINKKYLRKAMEESADMESLLLETIKGIQSIKAFTREKLFNYRLKQKAGKLLTTLFVSSGKFSLSSHFTEMISSVWLIIILWYGAREVMLQNMTTGQLLSFYSLYAYLSAPLISLIMANRSFQDAKIAAERLFQIMDIKKETDGEKQRNGLPKNNIAIYTRNISFCYPGKLNVLNNISLVCKPSTITAIAGESGSGKSTLISLLMGFNRPDKGTIFLNSFNQNEFSLRQLREFFSWVPQTTDIFSGTLADNISMQEKEADNRRITEAIELSNLQTLIKKLPQGIYSHISEDGHNFSGGEKQKIAIARALYKNSPVIIMDEPTLNLDLQSEINLTRLLKYLRAKGKTIVLISHKLNLISEADTIYYLKDGHICESGSHSHLIEQNGFYAKLWKYENLLQTPVRQEKGSPNTMS